MVRKILVILTTMVFALTLAAAAQAQVVKTPHKSPKTPAASQEAATPATQEKPKSEEKTPETVKPGHRTKHQSRC